MVTVTAAQPGMSRRGFLGGGSAAAVAAVITGRPAGPAGEDPRDADGGVVPLSLERRMIVQLARAGIVFPVRIPVPGQHGALAGNTMRAQRALSRLRAAQDDLDPGLLRLGSAVRPSLARLQVAEHSMPASDLAVARGGADLLIRAGLLDSGHGPVLAGVGKLAADVRPPERAALAGAVTLAVRSVFDDAAHARVPAAAGHWLNVLAAMHGQGTLRPAIRQRGL
jgi:hypothetical protein